MDIQQLTNAMDAYGGNVAGTTSETTPRRGRATGAAASAQGDTVQVSQDGQLLNVARKAAQEAPDVRAEKVEQLRAEIANGTYARDSRMIAAGIIRDEAGLFSL